MRKGWFQTDFCKKLNLAISNLSGYERGQREPGIKRLAILADLYDVSTDWLFGRNEYTTHNEREIIKDPQLSYWYNDLTNVSEEDLRKLQKVCQIIKDEKN
jgi:transcriptional regulator with XRE-family HTH domain